MNITTDRLFPKVEDMLDWTARRQQTLSANIANMDTPGYHAKDVSFAEHLRSVRMLTTEGAHLNPQGDPSMRVYEVGTDIKANGNSVDLDREVTEISKNGLQYVTLVQFLNSKLRTLRSAIADGGR